MADGRIPLAAAELLVALVQLFLLVRNARPIEQHGFVLSQRAATVAEKAVRRVARELGLYSGNLRVDDVQPAAQTLALAGQLVQQEAAADDLLGRIRAVRIDQVEVRVVGDGE